MRELGIPWRVCPGPWPTPAPLRLVPSPLAWRPCLPCRSQPALCPSPPASLLTLPEKKPACIPVMMCSVASGDSPALPFVLVSTAMRRFFFPSCFPFFSPDYPFLFFRNSCSSLLLPWVRIKVEIPMLYIFPMSLSFPGNCFFCFFLPLPQPSCSTSSS